MSKQAPQSADLPAKPMRKATRKEKALARLVATNPKLSQHEAYKMVYGDGNASDRGARANAHAVLKRPPVQLEIAKYSQEAEAVMQEVLQVSRERMTDKALARAVDWASNARQTADSILDRIHGKPTQRVEQSTTAVTLNIDLTNNVSDDVG